MQEHITDFVTLFVVIDPIGSLSIYLAATATMKPVPRRRVAVFSVLAAFGVLVFFIVAGQLLLGAMGIPLRAFQIAGGIVLFLFALTMVLGSDTEEPKRKRQGDPIAIAIYPVAIPAIAGPGAMLAVVLLTDNDRFDLADQMTTTLALALVLAVQLVIFLAAGPISRAIGAGGANIIRRVMGMILAAVAVNMALTAVVDWLGLPAL